ncbi:hypothetical protein HCN44_002404 [Aphidius gifuensis]|uniref:Uncharacterized protein n=1 Tax=Aphidius gifuensis TaxID=684658 RepID=A0A834Y367_APHGI|nr:hypothetical protein HCN44_002404 [Aphidius gifuensis]
MFIITISKGHKKINKEIKNREYIKNLFGEKVTTMMRENPVNDTTVLFGMALLKAGTEQPLNNRRQKKLINGIKKFFDDIKYLRDLRSINQSNTDKNKILKWMEKDSRNRLKHIELIFINKLPLINDNNYSVRNEAINYLIDEDFQKNVTSFFDRSIIKNPRFVDYWDNGDNKRQAEKIYKSFLYVLEDMLNIYAVSAIAFGTKYEELFFENKFTEAENNRLKFISNLKIYSGELIYFMNYVNDVIERLDDMIRTDTEDKLYSTVDRSFKKNNFDK